MRLRAVAIHLTTGSDAFGDTDYTRDTEVARILHDLAEDIQRGQERSVLRDTNGNTVGTVHLTYDEE